MADPLLGATAQVLLEKLLSLATENIGLVFGFKKDVERLRRSVAMIQAVIADAERKQQQQEAVKLWLKSIEEVAYEADHVFDQLNYELLRRRVETARNPRGDKVCFFFSSSQTVSFRWWMARKVRNINLKLRLINEEAKGFGLQSQLLASGSNTISDPTNAEVKIRRETDSLVDQNVVGRANDASNIVQKLLSPSAEAVSFIPITGMGGLGKTSLAQLIYNDARISNFFDRKIWVCVSSNFDATRIFKLILESLRRKNVDIVSRDAIVQETKGELQGKRYLLVLDDVWCENSAIWDDFLHSLVGISTVKGNWSLLTTRLLQVASIVTANPPFTLEKLSDDDCWSILKGKAFANGEALEELNAMKEEIIGACQGLPLAASVIGGLLRINPQEEWLSIVRNKIPSMTGSITQILRLSFDHLPSASVKKCFAYCSLFTEGSDMEKDMLIQLWMAEGFLQSSHGNEMEMEAIGLRYFDILVKSSLFQEVRKENGLICGRMHDLVHDLAKLVSESETIYLEQGFRFDTGRVRYLVLKSLQANIHTILKERAHSLHTIFVQCGLSNDLLLNFKCLHVLNLSRVVQYKEFPNSICKLIHLRYLDLSPSGIEALPESLCKLYNLQTLRISGFHSVKKLPKGMSNLISLRHFHSEFWEHFQMPLSMGKLTSLQTFQFFNIGREKGRQIEEIGWLTNLRGRLTIRNLELVNGKEEARLANLSGKPKLIDLTFKWGRGREDDNIDEVVLEGLEPHPNLQKLVVENFMGFQFPWWIMRMACMDERTNLLMGLNKLVNLRLINCKSCENIPALGQLPLLKSLQLYGLDNLRCIGFAFYGVDNCSRSDQLSRKSFPALQSLELESLPNLVDWMGMEAVSSIGEAMEVFSNLEELRIQNCPQLITAPNHFPCLRRLIIRNAGRDTELLLSSICNKITTLTALNIGDAEGLTCVPDVVFRNNQNLVSLALRNCYNLTHATRFSLSSCKNLRELYITGCPNLKAVLYPSEQQLPSSLRTLQIIRCNELQSLPGELVQNCTYLKSLLVCGCPNLVSFPVDLQKTPYLSYLDLSSCPKLINMPKGFLSCVNLRTLEIGPFPDSVEFDWLELSSSSVCRLKVHGCPHTVSLPDELQCLVEITELSLLDFEAIESLPDWLENLVSLEQLNLSHCYKLMYLPSSEILRRLTNLRELRIDQCPMLKKRCAPNSGANSEWSKISHISDIIIDGRKIK